VWGAKSWWLPVILSLAASAIWSTLAFRAIAAEVRPARHEGVASCSGSTCHGRDYPREHGVRLDEIVVWQDDSSQAGAHSRAWQVLGKPRAQGIAARLGLGSAQSAPLCTGCHVEPAVERGPKFQQSDGVGCEACHGGSSTWLASHYAVRATHRSNVANGMVPLEIPKARAEVCLNCHFGSSEPNQFVSHRMMAAGHPPVSFELDWFSESQRHYDLNADYARRKIIAGDVKFWSVGQAMALERALTLYDSSSKAQTGSFPEFYFFDCQTCHRQVVTTAGDAVIRAAPNPDRPVPVGIPAFNDSNMIMLLAAARVAAPDLATRFESEIRAFHSALDRDRESAIAAAGRLAGTARDIGNSFEAHTFRHSETKAILYQLVGNSLAARYTDWSESEQVYYAICDLETDLRHSSDACNAIPSLRDLYKTLADRNSYSPAEFRNSLLRVDAALRGLRQ
jgi:hypothetical protein